MGETRRGGYAERAVVDADWLVPAPDRLSTADTMALGTAGLAAMLGIVELERSGVGPEAGPVLVTGASGGVGSLAVLMLAGLGYDVCAATGGGQNEAHLRDLGAQTVIDRGQLGRTSRPLESETWAGCIDAVGGHLLSTVLGRLSYGGAVAAVGLAAGSSMEASLIPFLLRGVRLVGIDSVMQPYAARVAAWERIVDAVATEKLSLVTATCSLEEVPSVAADVLRGQVRGRYVVDLDPSPTADGSVDTQ